MDSQKYLFNILFVVAAICVLLSHASPVPEQAEASDREGRFYGTGFANAQASAVANANAGSYGGGFGYPGYGIGGANAIAAASANAGAFGK